MTTAATEQRPQRRYPNTRNVPAGALQVVDAEGLLVGLTLFQGTGEWSALYLDGDLVACGDHENVTERLTEILGVQVCYGADGDDAFDLPDGLMAAETVAAAIEQREARVAREEHAAELEARAAALDLEAEQLRRQATAERSRS